MTTYTGYAPGGGTMEVSFRTKLAQLIDSSWHHSWHWPNDYDYEEAALESLRTEFKYAFDRLERLREAKRMLESRGYTLPERSSDEIR